MDELPAADVPEPDAYQVAQKRLREHPGFVEHMRIQAFATTLVEVFEPNWRQLIAILNEISTNPDVAFNMLHTVDSTPGTKPDAAAARITQFLHNYVASSATLADHARPLMSGRTGALNSEYERRKKEMLTNPEIHFIKGLRNFSLHRALPLLAHTLTVKRDPDSGALRMTSEVELSIAHLLSWDNWNVEMRQYLSAFGKRLPLRPTIQRHHDLVYALNAWLIEELYRENRPALDEANELVIASNAALMGVDLETARRRTEQEERRRRTGERLTE